MVKVNTYKRENAPLKVAIVGAGISGLFIGWKLAERGEDVTIFEKESSVGDTRYAHLYSNRLLDFIETPKDIILNEIRECKIHFPKRSVTVRFSRPLFEIDYGGLNGYLRKSAEKNGVKMLLGSPIENVPSGFDRVIGSDGVDSKVRELLGMKELKKYFALQTILKRESKSSTCEAWSVSGGFLWLIPAGDKGTELGLVTDLGEEKARELFAKFCEDQKAAYDSIKDGYIPVDLSLPKHKKITLCGDSSGLVKPWSLGGVTWQLYQAKMFLETWPDFESYRRMVYRFFKPTMAYSKLSNSLVRFLGHHFPILLPQDRSIDPDFLFFQK